MKKLIACLMLGLLTLGALAGCYQTGKVAGETADTVEKGAEDTKEGYKDARDGK